MEASSVSPYRRWRRPVVTALLLALGESLSRSRGTSQGIRTEQVQRWRERIEVDKPLGQPGSGGRAPVGLAQAWRCAAA